VFRVLARSPETLLSDEVGTMHTWNNDTELFSLALEKLYTPVVGDILDDLGYPHQFISADIRAMDPAMKVIGFAMPVLMADVFGKQAKPFGLLTEALDQLQENEIYIATGGTRRCAYWGELLTATARMRGATGAVVDGYHRDTPQVLEQNWPVFSAGSYAQDSAVRTQVIAYRCPIEIGQVTIRPGDIVFGDMDGVLIVPQHMKEEVFSKAFEKAAGEKLVRKAIEEGMSSTTAFETFGIL
jgi:4-hydroxy-4-methyl-2-oxoglutarate aldolase